MSEYKRRYDEIRSELVALLKGCAISDLYIHLFEEAYYLFACYNADNPELHDKLPEHPIMEKWWD